MSTTPAEDAVGGQLSRPGYYRDYYRWLVRVAIGEAIVIGLLGLAIALTHLFYWGEQRAFSTASDGHIYPLTTLETADITPQEAAWLIGWLQKNPPVDANGKRILRPVDPGETANDAYRLQQLYDGVMIGWTEKSDDPKRPDANFRGWPEAVLDEVFNFNPAVVTDWPRRKNELAEYFTVAGLAELRASEPWKLLDDAAKARRKVEIKFQGASLQDIEGNLRKKAKAGQSGAPGALGDPDGYRHWLVQGGFSLKIDQAAARDWVFRFDVVRSPVRRWGRPFAVNQAAFQLAAPAGEKP